MKSNDAEDLHDRFDPLAVAGQAYFPGAEQTTKSLLAVLRKHRATAVGFVNEGQLDADPPRRAAREALLLQWIDAGMTLGNHTYSHPDFNTIPVEAFKDEIARGEPTVRRLMASRTLGAAPLFFRHPMNHTGDTREKKAAALKVKLDGKDDPEVPAWVMELYRR